ncbi:MAG: UDP-2,3-diacylglucosamine diphosphatase, partial [Verrucomicrobia bacterium]|nr:UDP-2,3-diacylglucosamine diphosphatase [Verrucomicrobiota bacterium]
ILYCNDGDWVESLTALVEHPDGRLEIIDRSACRTAWGAAAQAQLPLDVAEPA